MSNSAKTRLHRHQRPAKLQDVGFPLFSSAWARPMSAFFFLNCLPGSIMIGKPGSSRSKEARPFRILRKILNGRGGGIRTHDFQLPKTLHWGSLCPSRLTIALSLLAQTHLQAAS